MDRNARIAVIVVASFIVAMITAAFVMFAADFMRGGGGVVHSVEAAYRNRLMEALLLTFFGLADAAVLAVAWRLISPGRRSSVVMWTLVVLAALAFLSTGILPGLLYPMPSEDALYEEYGDFLEEFSRRPASPQ